MKVLKFALLLLSCALLSCQPGRPDYPKRVSEYNSTGSRSFKAYASYPGEVTLMNSRSQMLYYTTNRFQTLTPYIGDICFILLHYSNDYLYSVRYFDSQGTLAPVAPGSYAMVQFSYPDRNLLDRDFVILDEYDGNTEEVSGSVTMQTLDARGQLLSRSEISTRQYWGWHNRLSIRPTVTNR